MRIKFSITLLLLFLLLSACAPASTPPPSPTAQPQEDSSPTPAPTDTPLPPTASETPLPSDTSTPEPTLEPSITPTRWAPPTLAPGADAYEDWLVLFDYDQAAPLDIEERGVQVQDGVSIHDILYSSAVRGRVKAFLVVPEGEGPFAGMVYMHWYEPESATNSRNEFLDEAVELAQSGVVSVLVQGFLPWSRPPDASDYEVDRAMVIHQVLELRRAVDLLASRDDVDPQRIGLVGHDFGAMYGGILAGVDPRPKTYVLMAPTGRFADWFLLFWPSTGDKREEYKAGMNPIDPINYYPQADPASLYFQFGGNDTYVSESAAQEQFDAASEPKTIKIYQAEHELNDAARRDRLQWLRAELSLDATP